ncbi:hypothetical protein J2794_006305 [Paraburkholderia terricola]|uniref:hypothetical protein n=1 Tax=Paraburkholderia terricola TaxID=169427 RepID=UPI0028563A62|nr:hypothetical protein [Paraburkholderia terricola]MDR6450165.1 hypothetical protein [Paraburkholderia terricola]
MSNCVNANAIANAGCFREELGSEPLVAQPVAQRSPSVDPRLGGLRRRTDLVVEGTFGELRTKAAEILGPSFDESAFREMMATNRSATLEDQIYKAHSWVWRRLYPLASDRLIPLGKGTDHAVYTDPDRPDIVFKVSVDSMFRLVQWNLLFGRSGHDAMPEVLWEQAHAIAAREAERHAEMCSSFPPGSVPAESVTIEEVPVRGIALQYIVNSGLYPDARRVIRTLQKDEVFMVPALVRRQDRLHQLAGPSNRDFSLSARFIERLKPPPDVYAQANDAWVLNRDAAATREAFDYCLQGTRLKALYEACETNSELRDGVRNFLSCGIDFMNRTGELLDVGGDTNVFFDEHGKFYLPDAMCFPSFDRALHRAVGVLDVKLSGKSVPRNENWMLIFSLNMIRAVNSMAHAIGLEKRVHLLPPNEKRKSIPWNDLLQRLNGLQQITEEARPANSSRLQPPVFFPTTRAAWTN